MDNDELITTWQTIANGWKQQCLTHIETMEKITELVKGGESNENLLDCLRSVLKEAKFITKQLTAKGRKEQRV